MSRPIGEVPTRTIQLGDVIFREDDDAKGEAFMVHVGRVDIRKQIGGEERLLRTLAKGELLGQIALFRNAPRSATAIAADAVTLMVIPANRLDHLVRANPALALALIRELATMMLAAEDRLREVGDRQGKKEPPSGRAPAERPRGPPREGAPPRMSGTSFWRERTKAALLAERYIS